MELSNILSNEPTHRTNSTMTPDDAVILQPSHSQGPEPHISRHYPTRQAISSQYPSALDGAYTSPTKRPGHSDAVTGHSGSRRSTPSAPPRKQVSFELLLDENSKTRARIPMRVFINHHDTTNDIVATVKNFYGLYEQGVSFEDNKGNTLIASYENVHDEMVVYVRVVPSHLFAHQEYGPSAYYGSSPVNGQRRPSLGEPFQLAPPAPAQILDYGQPPSRPTSRVARKRSASPQSGRGRRSVSAQKAGSRSGVKSRGSSAHESFHEDGMNVYSDSENGRGSVTSSMRARGEQFASAEISLENIVQEERRKRPRFESSELPLYVPPQIPFTTSTSSISPQRRSTGQEGPSPFARPTQRTFSYNPQPLPSPQSHGYQEQYYGGSPQFDPSNAIPAPQHSHRLRDRSYIQPVGRSTSGRGGPQSQGVLPTPDPTIASCISDEDVARQLIALGDASNISHGRISASTLDDALSGAADAASSVGATSDSEEESEDDIDFPPRAKQRLESSVPPLEGSEQSYDEVDGEYHDHDGLVKSEHDEYNSHFGRDSKPKKKSAKVTSAKSRPTKTSSSIQGKLGKGRSQGSHKKSKLTMGADGVNGPSSANNIIGQVRKTSSASTLNFQHQLAADEEDLSSKPRCQRCRKSKKGCDRQRPCQRCKDAGIGIEGCISEDEGNGRKGRYGRHMGVPVKKEFESANNNADFETAGAILTGMASGQNSPEKGKKRKR